MCDRVDITTGSTLVFYEVTVTVKAKTILKRVSGMASGGEILAIIGPSGTLIGRRKVK